MRKNKMLSLFLAFTFIFALLPDGTLLAAIDILPSGSNNIARALSATMVAPEPVATDENTNVDSVLDMLSLILIDTSYVTTNLELPTVDDLYGTTITWSSSNVNYLWVDGTVIRPPSGKDVTVTLTTTVSLGEVTKTKDFIVEIPAYESNIRAIDTVHMEPNAPADEFDIDVPVDTSPKLPYRVWVNYSDGYGEWRQTQWPWSGIVGTGADRSGPVGSNTPPNQEEQWKAKPVGEEYTVTGWIIGDNATDLGYPLTANCTVVDGNTPVPNNIVAADTLPMSKVTLIGENRLTSNASRAVTAIASWNPDQYLYNYRDTYGLEQPEGVTAFRSGWEAPSSRLRGHGTGHFIDAMCLAYVSGQGTDAERQKIFNNIVYMIDELRTIQELTFVQTGEDDEGNPIYREGSNVWPYYAKDKEELSSDWPFALLSEITSPVPNTFVHGEEGDQPEWFGYGYLHATPPLHPVLNEAYRPYSEWTWAPYYSVHKQLAGFMDVYYTFKDDPDTSDTAEKALLICKDMSRWISDRLTIKCRVEPTRDTTTYGNLNATWYANISGEYGGVNESIARCAYALDDNDPVKALLLRGSEMFDNKSYWDPLAENSEIMWNGTPGIGGNSHANQRIPQMPGVLWSYRGNGEERYYNIAKNFFDFGAGRYRYYGGNVGVGEWYNAPYTQINNMTSAGNETCCATNLARLSKDLACFEPDNAEYMDYYERVMYNQLVGSLHQNAWSLSYQYALGPNTAKPTGNSDPGSTCCGGTGAENHVRYTDATYLVSDKAIWVNLYMPTQCVWDVAGITLTQDCLWPAENSKITVAANADQTQKPFSMHLRVPAWATRDFDIKLNGESIANLYGVSFTPSSYVVIPERAWSDSDVVEISMRFVESIDYGPDRKDGQWAGVIFYGPLAMAGTGAWSTLDIDYSLSNITKNGYEDLANTSAATPGNNRTVYSMSVTGQSHENADVLQPDYYTGLATNSSTASRRTLYYMINMVSSDDSIDRMVLYNRLRTAREFEAGSYSSASFTALRTAIRDGVDVYQNTETAQADIDTQVSSLQVAIDSLVPLLETKAGLYELMNKALRMKAEQEAWEAIPNGLIDDKPCAPYGYARMLVRLAQAWVVYGDTEGTQLQINNAYSALDEAINGVRKGYMPEIEDLAPLNQLLEQAKVLTANDYSLDSYLVLLDAIASCEEEVAIVIAGSSTINQETIPSAIKMLQDALDGLTEDPAGEKVDLWSDLNYTFFSGDSDFSIETEGNYFREGALVDLQEWSSIWHFQWRLMPDDDREYFQFRRRNAYSATATTVLAPYNSDVTAGTVLIMVHGDATNDSQWWKPVRQDNGQFIIVNKANPALCIALQTAPAAANGRVGLASLDAPENTWRILGAYNSASLPGTPPVLPLEKKVISVAPLADIWVYSGTDISDIKLPTRVSVTYEDNSKALRDIDWDISTFDDEKLTGTIALDGIEVNPNGVKALVYIKEKAEPITVSIDGETEIIANGQLTTYTANPSTEEGVTYLWSASGGLEISGSDTGKTVAVIVKDNTAETSGTVSVTVSQLEADPAYATMSVAIKYPVIEVSIIGSPSVKVNATTSLTGIVTPDYATLPITYDWESSDPSIAAIEKSADGKSATVTGVTEGSVDISFKAQGVGDEQAFTIQTFEVKSADSPYVPINSVSIHEGDKTIKLGGPPVTFTAVIDPADATDKNIEWDVSDSSIIDFVQGTTINGDAVQIVPKAAGQADLILIANKGAALDTKASGAALEMKTSVKITVEEDTTPLTVTITGGRNSVGLEQTLDFGYTTNPSDAAITKVEWKAENGLEIVSDADKATVKVKSNTVGTGKLSLKVYTDEMTYAEDSKQVIVILIPITEVNIQGSSTTVRVDSSLSFKAEMMPSNATTPKYEWRCDDGISLTSSQGADSVIIRGDYVGTAKLYLSITAGGAEKTAEVTITVNAKSDGNGGSSSSGGGRRSGASLTKSSVTDTSEIPADTTPAGIATPGGQTNYVSQILSRFNDASSIPSWASSAVASLTEKGVISGRTTGGFDPTGNITRAEFVTMVVISLGFTNAGSATAFSDITEGDWFKNTVDIGTSNGIVRGIGNNMFAPNNNITRQDLCVMLYNALTMLGVTLPQANDDSFADDATISAYAKDAIYAFKSLGIVNGHANGNFEPKAPATRAESAVIINGVLNYYESQTAPAEETVPEENEVAFVTYFEIDKYKALK